MRAVGEVPLEPAPPGGGQGALEVVGDQLDRLLADEVTPSQTGAAQPPAASKRDWSTAGSAVPIAMLRRSRSPVVLARLTRMRNSQVRNEERSSKPPMPRTTPIQVSWTTSSATARLGTNEEASRSMAS